MNSSKSDFKMQQLRSPFGNIFNIMNGLPQGHEKPLKHALYNAVALFLLIISLCVCWALYLILQPFIKPLTWALLVGSVLHPIKYKISTYIENWFSKLELKGTPLFVGVGVFPFQVVNRVSYFIGNNMLKRLKLIISLTVALPLAYVLYYYTPDIALGLIWNISSIIFVLISYSMYMTNIYTMLTTLAVLLISLSYYWNPETSYAFRSISFLFWFFFTCYLSKFAPNYEVHIFVFLIIFYTAGLITEVIDVCEKIQTSANPTTTSVLQCIMLVLVNDTKSLHNISNPEILNTSDTEPNTEIPEELIKPPHEENNEKPSTKTIDETDEIGKPVKPEIKSPFELELFAPRKVDKGTISPTESLDGKPLLPGSKNSVGSDYPKGRSKSVSSSGRKFMLIDSRAPLIKTLVLDKIRARVLPSQDSEKYTSGFYIYIVFWACVILILWKNMLLCGILPIPIAIFLINKGGAYFGIWELIEAQFNTFKTGLYDWIDARADSLIPPFIRGNWKIICKMNAQVESLLRNSIDSVASVVVILGLILFVILGSVFVFFQVYSEGIMLVQIGSNVLNSAIVNNPELLQYLPPEWNDTVDAVLDNAYLYGREGISRVLRGAMRDVEDAKAIKLEHQVLELWDRIYQSWVYADAINPHEVGPKVSSTAVQHSWDEIVAELPTSTEIFNIQALIEFVKQNIGTFMSLLESVWSILKGNINLVVAFFSAFISILFGGGTAVLNFVLNVIVFLTTLFYLLAASGRLYKPVEFMSTFSTNGSQFGLALEQAINGVFKATGQMALFYGLWTWFIHTLFNVRIVYLPTVLATILAAVPFLGPYWACLPAVLNLWLAQDRPFTALLFAIFQLAPSYFIDTKIYEEIKGGGHPYLTALAIAGGVFWLGVEGAIIGPLLLCGLFVAFDLSSGFFKESPVEDRQLPRLHRYSSQPAASAESSNQTRFTYNIM